MNPSVKKVRRSAYEVSPACPHYNSCGGCDFLDLSYGRQLIEKRRWIERALIGSKVPLNTLKRTLGGDGKIGGVLICGWLLVRLLCSNRLFLS